MYGRVEKKGKKRKRIQMLVGESRGNVYESSINELFLKLSSFKFFLNKNLKEETTDNH